MNVKLKNDFEYYKQNQKKLFLEYAGKFIVIFNKEVVGVYDNEIDAYVNAQKEYKLGTFIIQKVEVDENSYSQTFYSHVSI